MDDSINTRDIEKSILESYGYKVDVAGDGMDALEKTKGFKYDLIITDIENAPSGRVFIDGKAEKG